jgi:hypothetical protein
MTEEDFKLLYENCNLDDDFDFEKYEDEIINNQGALFQYSLEDSDDTYDEAMIDYMKEQGFKVYDDPGNDEYQIGWVVFPP